MEQNITRRRLCFYGRVQGVGFRYTAMRAAGESGVSGWVRNEFDGSVTMELQGTSDQIELTVRLLDHDPYLRIDRVEGKTLPVEKNERGFRVRY